MAFGVQQAGWLLCEMQRRVPEIVRGIAAVGSVLDGNADVVVWEAFVTGKSKDRGALDGHVLDAQGSRRRTDTTT
jgi:hypothetical protein